MRRYHETAPGPINNDAASRSSSPTVDTPTTTVKQPTNPDRRRVKRLQRRKNLLSISLPLPASRIGNLEEHKQPQKYLDSSNTYNHIIYYWIVADTVFVAKPQPTSLFAVVPSTQPRYNMRTLVCEMHLLHGP